MRTTTYLVLLGCVAFSNLFLCTDAQNSIDPICADCRSRHCTYDKSLHCSCTSPVGDSVIEIGHKSDREYSRVSIGFAIDDTGSMGGVINSVKSTIQGVVMATSTIFNEFVLATFNDPYNYSLIKSRDVAAITDFVGKISAHGGNDCPEMALSGIRDVARKLSDGSALFAFTDASAKDFALEDEVRAILLEKDIRLNVLATGDLCEKRDSELVRLVQATNGSIYRTPAQWDVKYVMNYIRKYAKYGVRFIRGMPKSLEDLKAVANGTCFCTPGVPQHIACVAAPAAFSDSRLERGNFTKSGEQKRAGILLNMIAVFLCCLRILAV